MLGLMVYDWIWYCDEVVYDFFDELCDIGFFNCFKKVVFYGVLMGVYVVVVFSVVVSGVIVILILFQVMLDCEKVSWEYCYFKVWWCNFKDCYGYVLDYVMVVENVYVFYDLCMLQDVMYVMLFDSLNIMKFLCCFLGYWMVLFWV